MWQQAVHPGQCCPSLLLLMHALELLDLNSKMQVLNKGAACVRLHA
jgi:hypothetical protein